jgi:hypothetical protein
LYKWEQTSRWKYKKMREKNELIIC